MKQNDCPLKLINKVVVGKVSKFKSTTLYSNVLNSPRWITLQDLFDPFILSVS